MRLVRLRALGLFEEVRPPGEGADLLDNGTAGRSRKPLPPRRLAAPQIDSARTNGRPALQSYRAIESSCTLHVRAPQASR